MKISVIIPTFNGVHRIINALKAIEDQAVQEIEVIVVVDGSTDNTIELLKNSRLKFTKFNIISQENRGRAAVRNRGANEAAGDLLIFYDDDMRPSPDSIEKHVSFHQSVNDAVCGGNQCEEAAILKTDIQRFKAVLSSKWTDKYADGLNRLTKDNIFLTAANMSITKSLFLELGGFDERLTDAEDYEFAVRALEKGTPVFFDKSNLAWHDDFITCRSYIQRQRQYHSVSETLNQLLPLKYRRKSRYKSDLPFWKTNVYGFFAKNYWIKWIDKQSIVWMPKSIRYRIYDYVITGLGQYYPERRID